MNIKHTEQDKLTDINTLSVAFTRSGVQSHSGILYLNPEGEAKLLHLENNRTLTKESPNSDFVWLHVNLPDIVKNLICLHCDIISENSQGKILYDIDPTGITFDIDGVFTQKVPHTGLTCGTFILAVFRDVGIELINQNHWPIRENDIKWQKMIVNLFSRYLEPNSNELINKKIDDKLILRFRPEEVVSSATLKNMPNTFSSIKEPSENLLKFYEELNSKS